MAMERSLGKKKTSKPRSKKSKKHRITHTHIDHADNGGHTIRHSYEQGGEGEEPVPDTTHAVGDSDQLLSHLQDQLGGNLPSANAAGAGAAAAPPQGQMV